MKKYICTKCKSKFEFTEDQINKKIEINDLYGKCPMCLNQIFTKSSEKLSFVVFKAHDEVWITTPEKEEQCIKEIKDYREENYEYDRVLYKPKASILIEFSTSLNILD